MARYSRARQQKDKLRKRQQRQAVQQLFVFHPVDQTWRQDKLSSLHLTHSTSETLSNQPSVPLPLTKPVQFRSIRGDGNCFFRCVSYAVTGKEHFHNDFRLKVCDYMKTHPSEMKSQIPTKYENVEVYLKDSHMQKSNTWTTETEIYATTMLLQTTIFIYSKHGVHWTWLRYSSDNVVSDQSIYIYHKNLNHYEIVLAVENSQLMLNPEQDHNIYDLQMVKETEKTKTRMQHAVAYRKQYQRDSTLRKKKTMAFTSKYNTGANININKQCYPKEREKSNYVSSQVFRSHHQYKCRLRYATSALVRFKLKQNSKKQYATDILLKEKVKASSKQKYANDPIHKDRVKAYSIKKYKDNLSHRRNIKQLSQQKYKKNPVHKDQVKAYSTRKYKENPNHKDRVKEYSTRKYKENPIHKDRVKEYSTRKYKENPIHKDRVKEYSTRKYKENPIHKDRVKEYSTRKYKENPIHKDRVKEYSTGKYKENPIHKDRVKEYSTRKYKENPIHKDRVKEYSTRKYRENPIHKDSVKEYSTRKYKENPIHKDRVKAYSTRKYKENPIYKDRVKEYSTRKYKENQIHKDRVKAYSTMKYKENQIHKDRVKAYSTRKYRENPIHKDRVKAYSTRKYKENPIHKDRVKAYSTRKYKENPIHKESVRSYSTRKYRENPVHREKVKAYSIQKYRNDPCLRHRVQQYSKLKYQTFPSFRNHVKASSIKKYAKYPLFRKALKEYLKRKYKDKAVQQLKKQRVKDRRQSIQHCIQTFMKSINEPIRYVCTVFIRILYRSQVKPCKREKFLDDDSLKDNAAKCLTGLYVHTCLENTCSQDCEMLKAERHKEWICHTCDRYLKSARMPPQAYANNMFLPEIPPVLKKLNILEKQLVSMRIPFMKLLSLPRGGQKGVKGPVVNVPSDISSVTKSLPRNFEDSQLIKVKLKRKLSYKGHYKYQWINPQNVFEAVQYLIQNNAWYENVSLDESWMNNINNSELVQPDSDEEGEVSDEEVPVEAKNDDIRVDKSTKPTQPAAGLRKSAIETEQVKSNPDEDSQGSYKVLPPANENGDIQAGNSNNASQPKASCKKSDHEIEKNIPVETCFQPSDIGQELLDTNAKTLCFAPGEGQKPQNIFQEPGADAMAFPVLLPDGNFGLFEERDIKLSPAKYFNARLFSADSRFSTDKEFVFFAQYVTEINYIASNISLALRKGKPTTEDGKQVTASMIINSDKVTGILQSDIGYRFLQPVRGTPPYWQRTMKDLYAMIKQLGIPTWFVTFSAAEMRWDEVLTTLLFLNHDTRKLSDIEWSERSRLVADNPVTCARMFEHRVQALFTNLLMSPSHPIGHIVDFFYRTEFQQRGSPHIHCLFWIKDAPKLNQNKDEDICSFIDKFVTCAMPDEVEDPQLHEIVSTVQTHSKSHTKSCKKYSTTCRFKFPRPPVKRTFIAKPTSDEPETDAGKDFTSEELDQMCKTASRTPQQMLKDVWILLSNPELDLPFDSILALANLTYADFQQCLTDVATRNTIHLQRQMKDMWVNNYNQHLIRAWNANIDIQFVTDSYACVAYILSYISKAESEMGDLLQNAKEEIDQGNTHAAAALRKIGNVYLQNREVSAQEAIYRVCSLHLKNCSREVVFIPTGSNIMKMSLPMSILKSRAHQGEEENIWMSSVHEKYCARPNKPEFSGMSMVHFCSHYRFIPHPPKSSKAKVHELQRQLGYIQERTRGKEAVIRYPRFKMKNNPEEYYLTLLQLYLPHTEPITLPDGVPSFEEYVRTGNINEQAVLNIIEENRQMYEIDVENLEKAWEDFQEGRVGEESWINIAPQAESERLDIEMEKEKDELHEPEEIPELSTQKDGSHSDSRRTYEYQPPEIPKHQIQEALRTMNTMQQKVFYSIREWCLKVAWKQHPEPFHIFLTGGAGTGKSHLIKCVFHEATRILSKVGTSPDTTSVLLTAPTGTAAFNIGGLTIHSGFSINKKAKLPYQQLGENLLNTLRTKFDTLHILIIDEISMVDKKLLAYVHGRLCQIMHSKKPFGNVSILAVGDFYQLPPVRAQPLYKVKSSDLFDLWNTHFSIVILTEIMRQKEDGFFAALLNRMRTHQRGKPLLKADEETLLQVTHDKVSPAEADILHIFPTNKEVDKHNSNMITVKCNPVFTSLATDFFRDAVTGKICEKKQPLANCAPEDLQTTVSLGVGARIMLTRNLDTDDGLVNGAFGSITHIDNSSKQVTAVYVRFDNPKIGQKHSKSARGDPALTGSVRIKQLEEKLTGKNVTRRQFPLKLGWAATIHKVQGMTISDVVISLQSVFAPGMAYVALSRATSLKGLRILNFKSDAIYSSPDITEALEKMPLFLLPAVTPAAKTLSIIHHNTEGIIPHVEDIKNVRGFTDCDIICFTETWLTHRQMPTSLLVEYDCGMLLRKDAYNTDDPVLSKFTSMSRGGVAIFVKGTVKQLPSPIQSQNIEAMTRVIAEPFHLIVTVIYRPPTYQKQLFIRNICPLLRQIEHLQLPSIILGDFNDDTRCAETISIENLLHQHGYQQLVQQPTTESGSCIDLVFVKGLQQNPKIEIIPTYYSFHEAVKVSIAL